MRRAIRRFNRIGVVSGFAATLLGLAVYASAVSPTDSPKGKSVKKAPTFSKDIAPILYKNCLPCHRKGEVAPFTLQGFQDAASKASLLKAVTAKRTMPPWKAESHGEFQDER